MIKQYLKEFVHNVFIHFSTMILPKDLVSRLHNWNATWAFGVKDNYTDSLIVGSEGVGLVKSKQDGAGFV